MDPPGWTLWLWFSVPFFSFVLEPGQQMCSQSFFFLRGLPSLVNAIFKFLSSILLFFLMIRVFQNSLLFLLLLWEVISSPFLTTHVNFLC